jgi:hypothetical protein
MAASSSLIIASGLTSSVTAITPANPHGTRRDERIALAHLGRLPAPSDPVPGRGTTVFGWSSGWIVPA